MTGIAAGIIGALAAITVLRALHRALDRHQADR